MAKKRRPEGTGGLYHPTYRDRQGHLCHQTVFWIAYRAGGKAVRESTKTRVKAEAERILRKRLEAADAGQLGPDTHKTTLADLQDILALNYEVNGKERLRAAARLKHVRDYFEAEGQDLKARAITTDRLTKYQAHRLAEGAKPATVNRELAALRRAFRLAALAHRVESVPHFEMLTEDNVRKGFLERDQFEAIQAKAPEWLRPVLTFMYLTGWRRSEVLPLEWRQVDLRAGVVRLEPGTTKNKRGRTLPFHALPELRDMIEAQRKTTKAIERDRGSIIAHVFHNDGAPPVDAAGRPIPLVYEAWQAACLAAGLPGRLLHDFRRSAVRNMERSGVSRSVAMQITGHLTESIYRRYAIVSEADIADGLAKVAALGGTEKAGTR